MWRETIHGDGANVVDEVVVNQPRRSRVRWVSLTEVARKVSEPEHRCWSLSELTELQLIRKPLLLDTNTVIIDEQQNFISVLDSNFTSLLSPHQRTDYGPGPVTKRVTGDVVGYRE